MEKEKKPIYKKWWLWVSVILIVSASVTIIVRIYNNNNTTFNNYKKQSITILTQYRDGKLTRKETEEKIDAISDKTYKDYTNDDTSKTLFLSSKLQKIEWDLVKGELSDTEVNDYIKEIEEIK